MTASTKSEEVLSYSLLWNSKIMHCGMLFYMPYEVTYSRGEVSLARFYSFCRDFTQTQQSGSTGWESHITSWESLVTS